MEDIKKYTLEQIEESFGTKNKEKQEQIEKLEQTLEQETRLALEQLQSMYERQSEKMTEMETDYLEYKESATISFHAQTTKIYKLEQSMIQLVKHHQDMLSALDATDDLLKTEIKKEKVIESPRQGLIIPN